MLEPIDNRTKQVENALERNEACQAKSLLSNMSYDEVKSTLFAAAEENRRLRAEGKSLPSLAITEGQGAAKERVLSVYNSARPFENILRVSGSGPAHARSIEARDKNGKSC